MGTSVREPAANCTGRCRRPSPGGEGWPGKAHGLSEGQFKSELAGAWTTNLVELTLPAQLSIEHARRLAEIGCAERGLHLPKVRIVENVECFCAELKLHTPEEAELP